ncbi:hypothetical protein DMH04_13210 [Kibdelosporangium aridum]|uniref:Uncharacterized protein n=1 Tax=Kibdelosporangium aridum TaxID=2030 RepID=A0A428ZEW0_KIBAR|nr:hypothetical protein DMH04_13210 [Kibdelosporangium aridum]
MTEGRFDQVHVDGIDRGLLTPPGDRVPGSVNLTDAFEPPPLATPATHPTTPSPQDPVRAPEAGLPAAKFDLITYFATECHPARHIHQ